MVALIVLVGLIVVGGIGYLMINGVAFFGALASHARDERRRAMVVEQEGRSRAEALAQANLILNRTFQGPSVTVQYGPASLPFEAWVAGAADRGYALAGQREDVHGLTGTLVFTRWRG